MSGSSRAYQLIQTPLFDHHVFTNNEPVRGHFIELGKHAIHVFLEVDENNHRQQVSAGVHQV